MLGHILMAMHIDKDIKRNLTIITAAGKASSTEIIDAFKSSTLKGVTEKVLLDLSKAKGKETKMMGAELKELIETSRKYHKPRKMAVVAIDPVIYGLSKMAEAQIQQYGDEELTVFKSLLDAFVWLENDKQIL
jgi:hypothetical protein